MTNRIEALTKMMTTCSPEMRPLYQQQLDRELAELKDTHLEAERKRLVVVETIKSGDDNAITALAELEFGGDYRVHTPDDGITWITVSDVARLDQAGEYEFDTVARAYSKRRWLMLQRLYSKYVRTGEVSSLSELA